MRIPVDFGVLAGGGSVAVSVAGRSDPSVSRVAAGGDRVSLSVMRELEAAVGPVAARQVQRVADVERAVSLGAYPVDPGRIARQLINEAQLSERLEAMLR